MNVRPDRARGALAVLGVLLAGAACGGGASGAAPKSAASAGGERALPPLPDDPLAVLPAGAQLVLIVDLAKLRASPHFATLARWIERQTCTPEASSGWLLGHARSVVLAGMPDAARPDDLRPLTLWRTDTAPGDAVRVLDQERALLGKPPLRAQEQARGRHAYVEADGSAAARLGATLLAVGDAAQVAAVLATADGAKPAFPSGDSAAGALRDQGWFSTHTAALGGRMSERGARRVSRSLSGVGASGAVEAPLERGSLALALDLDRGLRAHAQVELPDAPTAREAADSLTSAFERLDLPLRLFGLPLVIAHPSIRPDGPRLTLKLELDEDELREVIERLDGVIAGSQPPCAQQQASGEGAPRSAGES